MSLVRCGFDGSARRRTPGVEITDYDPLDPATAAQPFGAYRKLHAGGRVVYNRKRSTWILSRYEDVRAALTYTDRINSTQGVTRLRFSTPVIVLTDGKQHAELRKKVQPGFTKRAIDAWTPMIDELARDLVADVLANPGCDVVQRLAIPALFDPINELAFPFDTRLHTYVNGGVETAIGLTLLSPRTRPSCVVLYVG